MIDVRNAISQILDRYSLADIVSVTMRKMERDGVDVPFEPEPEKPIRQQVAVKAKNPNRVLHANPLDGFLSLLTKPKKSLSQRS